MKILAVADSHGSPVPLSIAARLCTSVDAIVFLGDFFDHEDEEYPAQKRNFQNVIGFKKRLGSRVHILLGNHDANYLVPGMREWQPEHAREIRGMLRASLPLLDVFFVERNWLFSHAGMSGVWLERYAPRSIPAFCTETNAAIRSGDYARLAFCGTDRYGDDVTQNPLWIRPPSLQKSAIRGFNQVVGHSPVPDSERIQKSAHGDTLLFLDSEPFLRNVYAEIDTEQNQYEVKTYTQVWDTGIDTHTERGGAL